MGFALARTFAAAGHNIALHARSADSRVDSLTTELSRADVDARDYAADASDPRQLCARRCRRPSMSSAPRQP
ncbi:hypothetical protein B7495_10920 [Cryobacterium sp. LW097]|nr:hypothetical protein B7495_10920 [Cryobacterium sp. LW097]